ACGVPGEPTQSNGCDDAVCTPNTPPDDGSVNEGVCATGPFDPYCTIETFRSCVSDTDCPAAGDRCGGSLRECYTDNGVIGQSVSVAGVSSPTAPTLGALFCAPPMLGAETNRSLGLPGLVRVTVPGAVVLHCGVQGGC